MHPSFTLTFPYFVLFCVSAFLGFFLLSKARRVFPFIRPELLRRNVVTYIIGLCFFLALGFLIHDFNNILKYFGWLWGVVLVLLMVFLNVSIPYNIIIWLTEHRRFQQLPVLRLNVLIFVSIVVTTMVVNGTVNVFLNRSTVHFFDSLLMTFFMSGIGTLAYLFIRQNELEKKRKLFEKELELARLGELKTKAELEALHAKINPHFLYNALNSIADLSIEDGSKARQMCLSLADLFRYSINYSNTNYASVKEEIEMAEAYLKIEKIRFEDRLEYSIDAAEDVSDFMIPKFILQPVIENAVKHGLRNLELAHIKLRVALEAAALRINVYDNGPDFPEAIDAGYGLKSIFEKLEILFPGRFKVNMHNKPEKNFEIILFNQ